MCGILLEEENGTLICLPGDRRDHYETSTQVWELPRAIGRERQQREIAPTIAVLGELLADPAISKEPAEAKLRVKETLELLQTLTAWSDEMLRLDTETLTKVLRLGAKIKKLMGRETLVDEAAAPRTPPPEVTPAHLLGP